MKNIIFDLNGVVFSKDLKRSAFIALPEGVKLVRDCAEYNLYVCSNIQPHYLAQILRDYPELMSSFRAIITPQEAGHKKPSKEIFQYVVSEYSLAPEETILLDDHQCNIDAVTALGMQGILVTSYDDVRQKLASYAIL